MTERNTPDLDSDTWQETLRESLNDVQNDAEYARHHARIEELLAHVNASSLDINDAMPDLRTILVEANASRRAMRLRHALDKPEMDQALARARRASSPWAGAGAAPGGAINPTALPSALAPPPAVALPAAEPPKPPTKRSENRRNTAGRAVGAILAVVAPAVLVYALFVKPSDPPHPVAPPTRSSTTALSASLVASGTVSSAGTHTDAVDASVTAVEVDAAASPVSSAKPVARPRGSKTDPKPAPSAATSSSPPEPPTSYDVVAP